MITSIFCSPDLKRYINIFFTKQYSNSILFFEEKNRNLSINNNIILINIKKKHEILLKKLTIKLPH